MSADGASRPEPKMVATEYVRKSYAQCPVFYQDRRTVAHWQSPKDIEYAGAQFDRWLAAHDAEVRAEAGPEIGIPCADTKPHPAHAWQMSATGWCLCAGVVTEEPEWATERVRHWCNPGCPEGCERWDEVSERKVTAWVPVKQEGTEQ